MNKNPFDHTIKAPLWVITLLLLIPVVGIFVYQSDVTNKGNEVVVETNPVKEEIVLEDKIEEKAIIEPEKIQESIKKEECVENWVCQDWGECSEQYNSERKCEDLNKCGTYKEQPELIKYGCYREPKLGFDIEIIGDAYCQEDKKKALNLLKEKAPEYYNIVTKYVGIIECNNVTNNSFSYAYPMETIPRITIGFSAAASPTSIYTSYSTKQVAATIVHEALHNKKYFDYLIENKPENNYVPPCEYGGLENELEGAGEELKVMEKMDAYPHEIEHVKYRIKYPERVWIEWGGCSGMTYEQYINSPEVKENFGK